MGGILLLSIILCVCFLRTELKYPKKAIIPLNLFENATVCLCAILCLISSMAAYSYIFHLPIYIEVVLGKSASSTGIILAINFMGVMFGSLGSGLIMKKTGKYKALLLFSGLLYVADCGVLYTFDITTPKKVQTVVVCCLGLGYSSIITVALVALMSSVPPNLQAISSSVLYASRGFGSTAGVAISSSVFSNSLRYFLNNFITGSKRKRIIELALSSSDAVKDLPAHYKTQVIRSYMSSLRIVFIFILTLSTLTWLVSIPLKQHHLDRDIESYEEA